jgi:hypothetical protein
MAGSFKMTIQDKGLTKLVRAIHAGKTAVLEVGVTQESGGDAYIAPEKTASGAATVLALANFAEFGTEIIRARPFCRGWADENRKTVPGLIKEELLRVVAGEQTAEEAYARVGDVCQTSMSQRIVERGHDSYEPNSPYTIKKKGSDVPLIHTGQLLAAITYRLTMRNKVRNAPKKKPSGGVKRAKNGLKALKRGLGGAKRAALKGFQRALRIGKQSVRIGTKAVKQARKATNRGIKAISKANRARSKR